MKTHIFSSIVLTFSFMLITMGGYTGLVWGIGQLAPNQGKGITIQQNGKSYYENIGQTFSDDRYFWSRPSAVGYNAAGSAGSNKGPSNPDYLRQVQDRIDTFMVHHPGISKAEIPADLVTASGSGLDPHISPQAAYVQAGRIARTRSIPEAEVQKLVSKHIEGPWLGLFGPSKVNVLELNLALDQQ
ncbi:MAG: K(+)-transporting ATPase subunit C [Chitinophagales bacterium]|nr:K(+)-transporting ATPase subunit C [Chitinophagales bacterium]